MAAKEHREITATELNIMVFRYLQESGFLHSGFNFFHEASLGRTDIQGMNIPFGALIRVVHKGLQYIELEANSEVENDDEYHIFDVLDLITNDLDELKRKIGSSMKLDSYENDKEKKVISSGNTITHRTHPMGHKAQEINAKKQKICPADSTRMTSEKLAGRMGRFKWASAKFRSKRLKPQKK